MLFSVGKTRQMDKKTYDNDRVFELQSLFIFLAIDCHSMARNLQLLKDSQKTVISFFWRSSILLIFLSMGAACSCIDRNPDIIPTQSSSELAEDRIY